VDLARRKGARRATRRTLGLTRPAMSGIPGIAEPAGSSAEPGRDLADPPLPKKSIRGPLMLSPGLDLTTTKRHRCCFGSIDGSPLLLAVPANNNNGPLMLLKGTAAAGREDPRLLPTQIDRPHVDDLLCASA
jgi:hypothetical protein